MNKTTSSIQSIRESNKTGHFGLALYFGRNAINMGTIMRHAYCFGASYVCFINKKFEKQPSDTVKAWSKIPIYQHTNFDDFYNNIPYNTHLVGVELTEQSISLHEFKHPARCLYLLGSESTGLPENVLQRCHSTVQIPSLHCLNVAGAGTIICYDRISKILNNGAYWPR